MATGNFSFEKPRREQARKLKKEAKKQRKLDGESQPVEEATGGEAADTFQAPPVG